MPHAMATPATSLEQGEPENREGPASRGVARVSQRDRPILIGYRIAWALLVARLAFFDLLEILRARSTNDYASFHAAAVAIADGLDPYSPHDLALAARNVGLPHPHPYFYPPFLAELLVPMTLLQSFAARLVWLSLSVLGFVGAFALLVRWMDRRLENPDVAKTALLVIACAMWPLRATQWMGQVNSLVLLAIVAWWTERARRPRAAAVFLALGAAVKMSPALLLLVPLTQRRWRELAWGAGATVTLVLGSSLLLGARGFRFLREVLFGFLPGHRYHGLSVPIDIAGNHSLGALSFWLFDRPRQLDAHQLSPRAAAFHVIVVALLLLAWAVRTWRGATREGSTAALVVLMIIAPTFAFEHHVAFVVLPIALVLVLLAEGSLGHVALTVSVVAFALLTAHEGEFLAPARVKRWVVMLGHVSKLLPLLAVFVVALSARAPRSRARP